MSYFGLLDTLSYRCACVYLSDLNQCSWSVIRSELRRIPAEDYPVKEWNDAIQYLCHTKTSFPKAQEARAYLLNDYNAAGNPV